MFRHTVLFCWKPDTTEAQKKQAATQLALLPSLVSSVRRFALGPDAGVNPDNYDFAITADFDDAAGYITYRDDPRHREMVTKYLSPIIAKRAAVQYEFPA